MFEITLRFESAETLLEALDHIGDDDAPVSIVDGSSVRVGDTTYPLWDDFATARDVLAGEEA